MERRKERTYPTVQEAMNAASAAAMGRGSAYPGILYRQGGRRFIAATLPCAEVIELVSEPKPAPKKIHTYNVDENRNRPLEPAHVKKIKEYLVAEEDYLLPPILLNSLEPLLVFIYDPMEHFMTEGVQSFTTCWFVLPHKYRLHVTDGQHRIEGLREAIAASEDGRFYRDAVAVSIVEELDIAKTHQDFYDAAQVKALPPALLVEYDQREPINRMTREVVQDVPILKDRTLRAGKTIGKLSPMMFTNNMIRRGIVMLITGSDSSDAVAKSAIEAQPEMWRKRIVRFLTVFCRENPQWRIVAEKPREMGEVSEIVSLREKYLHFLAGGLMVIGGVGSTILRMGASGDEDLSPEQESYIRKLAQDVDWHKESPIWSRSIISDGPNGNKRVTASRAFLFAAIADAKRAVGLDLTDAERLTVRKVQETRGQPV